jgi:hypothetical protein
VNVDPLFEQLIGKVSHYALRKLHEEHLASKTSRQNKECNCRIKLNYGLQCRHNFPTELVIEDVDQFWHLKKKQGKKA